MNILPIRTLHHLVKKFICLLVTSLICSCSLLNNDFTKTDLCKFDRYSSLGSKTYSDDPVKVTYWGTSSLLVSDSKAKILIDGFVTRPSIGELFFGTEPDSKIIDKLIARYDLHGNLKAVVSVHSHHDHAMDAPIFAEKTGADLLGTSSTLNIARTEIASGINFKEAFLNKPYRYENFKITLLDTIHGSIPTILLRQLLGMGEQIVKPITYPARLWDYKESNPFSILIERGSESMLVHASTGVKQGSLSLVKADWIFLGISKLNELDLNKQNIYFDETVAAVEASRIVPIHWDDIFRSKQERLYPAKRFIGDFSQELLAVESQMVNYQRKSAIRLMKKGETIFLDNRTNPLQPSFVNAKSDDCLMDLN